MSKPSVLYIVSRFPKVTETFVVNEWSELTDRFDMHLAALVHTDEPVLHDATRAALERAWFPPRTSLSSCRAHGRMLWRAPRGYTAALAAVVRECMRRRDRDAAKTVVAFHQAVSIAFWVQERGINHVHAHFANHPATAGWVVHRLTGVPFSFTAHANDLFRDPLLLERKAGDAAFVVAISDYNRRLLAERVPKARVHVIHCGVDTRRFTRSARDHSAARRTVVCVAGFEKKKGHRVLVDAFARIAAARPGLSLVLVGDGPERPSIEALARTLHIDDRVAFLGTRSTDDVREQLALADVFVLPAIQDETGRMDGIPVALMEAMASGVPAVSTTVSGIPELLGDGAGVTVAPNDAAALSDAIARVLDDEDLARRCAERGRARVTGQFDLAREAAKLAALIDAAIAATP